MQGSILYPFDTVDLLSQQELTDLLFVKGTCLDLTRDTISTPELTTAPVLGWRVTGFRPGAGDRRALLLGMWFSGVFADGDKMHFWAGIMVLTLHFRLSCLPTLALAVRLVLKHMIGPANQCRVLEDWRKYRRSGPWLGAQGRSFPSCSRDRKTNAQDVGPLEKSSGIPLKT